MAEKTTDLLCSKLGVERTCQTAVLPLPGSEKEKRKPSHSVVVEAAFGRQGTRVAEMDFSGKGSELVCECEQVSRAEIAYAVKELNVKTLDDLRRRTRVGMGTCQSTFCLRKAAAVLAEELGTPDKADALLKDFIQERWKGIMPVCWGDQLREAEHMRKEYGK